jgi:hypothetical protein
MSAAEEVILNDDFAMFLGLPSGTIRSRSDIITSLLTYCDTNGLIDGQTINPNPELKELLDLNIREYVSVTNIGQFIWPLCKIPTREKIAFHDKLNLSNKLTTFLGLSQGEMRSRSEITKAIMTYCKEKDLMDGQTINPDAALTELFELDPRDYVCVLNLNRYLNHHFSL